MKPETYSRRPRREHVCGPWPVARLPATSGLGRPWLGSSRTLRGNCAAPRPRTHVTALRPWARPFATVTRMRSVRCGKGQTSLSSPCLATFSSPVGTGLSRLQPSPRRQRNSTRSSTKTHPTSGLCGSPAASVGARASYAITVSQVVPRCRRLPNLPWWSAPCGWPTLNLELIRLWSSRTSGSSVRWSLRRLLS